MGPCSSTPGWYLRKHNSVCRKKISIFIFLSLKMYKKESNSESSAMLFISYLLFSVFSLPSSRETQIWQMLKELSHFHRDQVDVPSFPSAPSSFYSPRSLFFIVFDQQLVSPSIFLPKLFRFYLLLLILCQFSNWYVKSPGPVWVRQVSLSDTRGGGQMKTWGSNYRLLFSAWRRDRVCDQFHSFRELSLCPRYVFGSGNIAESMTDKSSALLGK